MLMSLSFCSCHPRKPDFDCFQRETPRLDSHDSCPLQIFVTVGVAVGGSAWYLLRLARGPDVVWDRHGNSQPWNNVRQDQNLKMWSINQDFSSKCVHTYTDFVSC